MKLATILPFLVIIASCSPINKEPKLNKENFSDFKVNGNYQIGDWWHYEKRESELKKLSVSDYANYFQAYASEMDTINDTYYFFSIEKQDKEGCILTFLRSYESCCIDLVQVNYDSSFTTTGKGKMVSWGGDGGWGFHEVGEYVDDSTYRKTWVNEELTFENQDSSVYSVDSTIWLYRIDKNLNMHKIDTEQHSYERLVRNNPYVAKKN